MLKALTIRDFVIVDALTLDFEQGFSVLTGETGAGKSILIDALQLSLGMRSESIMVRPGAKRADVSAVFSGNKQVKMWLEDNALDNDESEVLLRRTVDEKGRSRAFINGVPVSAQQLRELASLLVDIHGQHAHQLLLKSNEQRLLLDRQAQIEAEVDQVKAQFEHWQAIKQQLQEAQEQSDRIKEDLERLTWQVNELDKLSLQEGEWETVNQDHERLSHAAMFIETITQAINDLSEADRPILSVLRQIYQNVDELSQIDPKLKSVSELIESAEITLKEAVYSFRDYLSRTELDPKQLEIVSNRLSELHQAARQFKVQPDALLTVLEEKRQQRDSLEQGMDLEILEQKAHQAENEYRRLATSVSQKRKQAATDLSKAVTSIMEDLHMTGGRFEIHIENMEPTASGTDRITFMVAGHAGVDAKPLAKVASGGELARISLAISVIASQATETPTLIFDEVDSGVGGAVAEVVGRLLKRLGDEHQVFCVTHLPQVASQAQSHFRVSKLVKEEGAAPVSQVNQLTNDQRVTEIARMLGGVELTSATINHAKEMLGDALKS